MPCEPTPRPAAAAPTRDFLSRLPLLLILLFLASAWVLPGLPGSPGAAHAAEPVSGEAAGGPEHGGGPYERLILRGVTVVDGTGSPPRGPMDVVIEGDRIVQLTRVGVPGRPIDPDRRPELGEGGRELDLEGSWVLPGFVDLYAHPGNHEEYAWKLWLAHGVTTTREPACLDGMAACLERMRASRDGEIVAPAFVPWLYFGLGAEEPITTSGAARAWVRRAAEEGARGIKFRGGAPEVLFAALDEAEELGVTTANHHSPLSVARADALDTARHGLDLVEHWYGLPEALLPPGAVQDFPPGYVYDDEGARFAAAGRLWRQAPPRGDEGRAAVVRELVDAGAALLPTLSLYEANRDFMGARRAEWHDEYTLPALWDSFRPDPTRHASHFYAWTSEDEAAWRENYALWMDFLDEYREAGGRVVAGSDSGFMYNLHGFGFIRELEMLREAGLSPLEVIRAATLWGAEELGVGAETGSIEPGKRADLVVVPGNPLADLKLLYGTGALRLGKAGLERVGGVTWTVKGGRTYDGETLRREVRQMVREAKEEAGLDPTAPMPLLPGGG